MKININELPDHLNEKDMAGFEELFDDIEKDAEISDEQQQRILSSVMRKAGNGMDTVIKNKRNINETVPQKTIETSKKIQIKRGGAIAACIVLLVVGGVMFSLRNNMQNTVPTTDRDSSMVNEIDRSVTKDKDHSSEKETDTADSEDKTISTTRTVQDWAKSYLEQNTDTVGFLKLKDLADNGDFESPVVQGEDNVFYLHHGFDKKENETGTVFADYNDPINEKCQPSNIVLFGYYTDDTDAILSSPILKYKDSKYFEQHNTIEFSTIFDDPETEYQVISCFNYDAVGEDKTDYSFRPRNFDDEMSFDEWISIVKNRAINKSDIECSEDDDYLTLVTKDSANGEDGRFAIVAKKVSETTAEEETSQKEDSLKESTKENRSVEKPDKAVSLKDRVKPDIHAKLEEAYPNNSIRRMNDDRYIISDMGSETSKVMVYDVSSDSVIFTLKDNEKIIDVFEDKFGTYKFVPSGDDKYAFLNVTIFDESGNILYTYEIDTKEAGISEGVENDSQMHISPDGKKLVYRDIQFHQDDKKLDIVDHFVIFKYEDQEHPVDIADYKGLNYVISFAVSNDLLLVYHMTPEFKRTPDLYSLYTDGKEDTAAYDIFVNDDGTLPEYNVKDSTINCSLGRYNELMIIKPDDNGDIRGGNADYSMIEYDLAGSEDGLHNYSLISESGRYVVTVYSTDDNKLIFTLYEIDGDNVTELKSIEKELIDPEYEVLLSASFNEQTGNFSVRRIIKTNETVTEDRIDSVNFYE